MFFQLYLFCLSVTVRRGDVLSAWSGIRPLVINPNAKNTQSIARNHIIDVSKTKLVTIAGIYFLQFTKGCFMVQ